MKCIKFPPYFLSSPTLSLHPVGSSPLRSDTTVLCTKMYTLSSFLPAPSPPPSPTSSLSPKEPRSGDFLLLYLQNCEFGTSPAADLTFGPLQGSEGHLHISRGGQLEAATGVSGQGHPSGTTGVEGHASLCLSVGCCDAGKWEWKGEVEGRRKTDEWLMGAEVAD
ncbi:hypothetical protein HJG60_009486 [Phyllostomus discolor]|uniref:Uncharacterized protein n=1 Tax=Phyllostomus discolor TaxID=89673 RepID=A0A833YIY0_9CHIR|nr:hypothetical protein HJG60_009486 [Phyllostomus discolor]